MGNDHPDGLLYHGEFLNIPKDWDKSQDLQRSIRLVLFNWVRGPVLSQAIDLVSAELLENIIRYTDWTHPRRPRFDVWCFEKQRIEFVSSNMASLDSKNPARFLDAMRDVSTHTSTQSSRKEKLQEAMAAGINGFSSSGLGLIRIAGEACAQLEGKVDAKGLVTTKATIDSQHMVEILKKRNEEGSAATA